MAGIPAGFEDNFYDDDDDDLGNFDYDEKDYTKCMNEEGIASVADSNKNTKPSYVLSILIL